MALILDTGPLYAALDRSDADHRACRSLIDTATEMLIVPAPVLVEVDYWIHRRMHPGVLVALLDDIAEAHILSKACCPGTTVGSESSATSSPLVSRCHSMSPRDYRRVRELCDRYADADIGVVDAAVLAIVERLNQPKLATLDRRHFGLLRPRHVDALRLLPE